MAASARVLGEIEQRRRLLRQPRPRHEHVAVAALLVEHVAHARLRARRRVARHAQRRRQLVGRQEADAPHVEREAVRVLAHARDRRGAVLLVDARRERGRDAVALQEDHHLAHLALRAPGRADGARARRPDARHLADAARVAVQDLQRLDAEAIDDARRELGPDALDQPRAEIAAQALDRLRARPRCSASTRNWSPKRAVVSKRPDTRSTAPAGMPDQAADDGDDVAAALELQARDGERAVAARVDEALDGPLQRRLGVVGRGPRPACAACPPCRTDPRGASLHGRRRAARRRAPRSARRWRRTSRARPRPGGRSWSRGRGPSPACGS